MGEKKLKRLSDEEKIYFESVIKEILTLKEISENPTRLWYAWAYRAQIGGSEGLYAQPITTKPDYKPDEPTVFEGGLRILNSIRGFCSPSVFSRLEDEGRKILEEEVTEGDQEISRKKAVKVGLIYVIKEAANPRKIQDCLKSLASVYRENPEIDEGFKPYHGESGNNGVMITKEHKIALREVLRNYED